MAASRKRSSASNRKKTSSRANTKRKTTKRKTTLDLNDNGLWDEAILFLLMALAVILLLSNFGAIGVVGEFLSGIMFGLFGVMAYVFPICLFSLLLYLFIKRDDYISIIKIAASVVLYIVLSVFSHLLVLKEQLNSGVGIYEFCKTKRGGGIIGGLLAKALASSISMAGTVILMLFLGIICFVLITEISIVSHVKSGSRRAVDMTREDARRYRERKAHRDRILKEREAAYEKEREEKKLRRMDNKVSGVSFDTVIKDTAQENTDISFDKQIVNDNQFDDDAYNVAVNEVVDDKLEEKIVDEIVVSINNKDTLTYTHEDIAPEPYDREISVKLNDTDFDFASLDMNSNFKYSQAENKYDEEIIINEDAMQSNPVLETEIVKEEPKSEIIEEEVSRPVKRTAKAPSEKSKLYKEATGSFEKKSNVKKKYVLPSVDLLNKIKETEGDSEASLKETAKKLVATLESFNVAVEPNVETSRGPAVTRYEMVPKAGVKVSKILNLADDIKLALAAADVRIEAPIPGKSAIGIEVPNTNKSIVSFREMVSSKEFNSSASKIAFGLGKDISGQTVISDISKMPHLLIAGSTGSGKSVCINTIIMSLLYKASPDEVKLIMVDPKVVELSVYNGIPHLMIPVVTDPKKATAALAWGVAEMTERYEKFAKFQVRDLKGYNAKIDEMNERDADGAPIKKLPQIVIIVDELADLMMVASKEVEEHICRLAQLARACGIHLVIATQRPSVDVITGLIKANMPSRIAFAVSSGTDSRTILDMNGAEKLLGYGDMLYYPQGYSKPVRIQGAFVSDEEVSRVVNDIRSRCGEEADDEKQMVLEKMESLSVNNDKDTSSSNSLSADDIGGHDPLFVEVGKFVIDSNKATIGGLQRKFKIGFNRAARIVDDLSDNGILGPEAGTKPREILMSLEQFEQWVEENL